MSTATGIDAKAYLAGWLQAVTGMTVADMNAIPDDQWSATNGGSSKACGPLMADAVTFLKWATGALRGEESDAYSHMAELGVTFGDKSVAVAGLNQASAELAAALAAASDETLNSMITAPWGQPAPLFLLALIGVNHIWYHDGQLNYIQTINGDEAVHWMM